MPVFIFMLLLILSSACSAQQFGGNPASVKWKQLNSDTARVIYPAGLDSQAQRVASIIHYQAAHDLSLGRRLQKINMVLQNQSTIANGYVGLGPYRSELFMTPSLNNFDLGSIGWADQLALHEYRHVQQFNNFRTGASKLMYYLFGEEGLALAINASVPDWFYEGDAVYNETIHSEQGRGRMPFFTNQFPSLWQSQKNYSWMKLRNGSFKDYVPDHYSLGFLMVNYGYQKYGVEFWKNVTQDAAAFKGLFYPFQKAIKKFAGVDYKTFRKEAFDFYKKEQPELPQMNGASQQKMDQGTIAGEENITTPNLNYVTNYFFPFQISDDSLLVLKNSYRMRRAFFIRSNQAEHRVRVKDIALDEQYSYQNGKLVYAAYKPDPRWGWRDYSEIRLLDLATGLQRKLTRRSKYFTPDISADGEKIVAVHVGENGRSELHVMNNSGTVLQKILSPEINLYTDPKFVNDQSLVSAIRFADGRMCLALINIQDGSFEKLTPPSFSVIGFPNVKNGMIYYSASYFGNDEVFALNLSTKKIYQVTSSALGKYFVSARKNSLLFSSFTSDGYQLRKTSTGNLKWSEINPMSIQLPVAPVQVAGQEAFRNQQLAGIPTRNFLSSDYSKGKRLFNFHSWRPYYEDPEFRFSLYGENVLNTFQSELYYLYNQNERTNAVGYSAVFGSLYPFITGGTQFTFGRTDTLNSKTRQWNQLDTRIGLQVPLNFSGGRFFRFMNFGSSYIFRIEQNTGPDKKIFEENNFSYLSHFFSYSQQVQQAVQHIFPRFGYSVSLQHRHAITKYNSYQFLGSGNLYLPGLASNHNIVLNGSFQQRDTFRLLFSNRMAYSRGYNELYFSRMWRLSGNYHLPILLPDWGFGNILYIQRVRANLFYDFTKVYSRNKQVTRDQRSAGVELFFDTKWWNQYELTFGIRASSLLDNDLFSGKKGTVFEFVLPVSIIPR